MSGLDWSRLVSKVKVLGDICPVKDCDWDALAERMKLPALPPSYVGYARVFGPGSWEPGLIISVPGQRQGPQDLDWESVSYQRILDVRFGRELRALYPDLGEGELRAAMDAYEEEFPQAQRERLSRLAPIGEISSYAWLCLDPVSIGGDGEMGLYVVPVELCGIVYCGGNLYEFLEVQWIDGGIHATLGLEQGSSFDPKPVFRAADAEGNIP